MKNKKAIKILFVDDDPSVLSMGELFIRSLGYQEILANSGLQAIEVLKGDNHNIQMIFLDLMMPIKSGYDVLEFMLQHSIKIPTVIQTGLLSQNDLDSALRLGACECLTKPYSKVSIKGLIEKYII